MGHAKKWAESPEVSSERSGGEITAPSSRVRRSRAPAGPQSERVSRVTSPPEAVVSTELRRSRAPTGPHSEWGGRITVPPEGALGGEPRWSWPPAGPQSERVRRVSAAPPAAEESQKERPLPNGTKLYRQYQRYVGKVGRSVLGGGGDLQDLVQDVFITALKDDHNVRDPRRVRGWLTAMTRRMARRRRFSRPPAPLEPADATPDLDLHDEEPSPESRMHIMELLCQLLELPDDLLTPWLLKHWDGWTLQEIAEEFDCSLSTAQGRIALVDSRLAARCSREE
jgi:RNA polymerase sigma-70 factor, ECF subfamily